MLSDPKNKEGDNKKCAETRKDFIKCSMKILPGMEDKLNGGNETMPEIASVSEPVKAAAAQNVKSQRVAPKRKSG